MRFLAVLLFGLSAVGQVRVPGPGGSAPSGGGGGGGTAPLSTTSGHATTGSINTTGATLLTCTISGFDSLGSGGTPHCADSKSNTWSLLFGPFCDGSLNPCIIVYYVFTPTVGTGHSFSTDSNAPAMAVEAWDTYTSLDTGTPVGANSLTGSNSKTQDKPGSYTPSSGGKRLLYTALAGDYSGSPAIDSSFTLSGNVAFVSGSTYGTASAYLVETSGGVAQNPNWTFALTTGNTTLIGGFK